MPAWTRRSERELILLAAGTAARRRATAERAARLVEDHDWTRLARSLHARRLLTVLGPRVLEIAGASADERFAAIVKHALEAGRRQGIAHQLVALRVLDLLAEQGIRCSALKGPILGEKLYGDLGRRSSNDIDVLVSPDQLHAAVEVVRGLGYGAPADHVLDDGLPLLHFMLVHEQGQLPPVELHWRVHWYERDFARERLLPPTADASRSWRPAPVDELAALLLFYARDGFIDLRIASDLSAWWDAYGAQLGDADLDRLLDAHPALARVISAAVLAAERVVGLPASQTIGVRRVPGIRERIAVRMVNPNPDSSSSQLYADMGLVDGLLAPAGGLGQFVRRQLLPPPEVLDQQARHGSKRRARSPFGRAVGVLARYALRIGRVALGAGWRDR